MLFNFFHLMPWPHLDEAPTSWPVSNKTFDAQKARELYKTYIDAMAYAEQCGFDWVGCNEHHFSPYGLMSNCNLIGSVLADRTKTIKLGMLGNLVPLLNPVRVAEEYAMLDVMSGGRLIAGFMRGIPHEYRAYNVDPDESHERLDEAARLIVKCWTLDEPFNWEGRHYRFPAVSIWPLDTIATPVQSTKDCTAAVACTSAEPNPSFLASDSTSGTTVAWNGTTVFPSAARALINCSTPMTSRL